jgi:hypothetical protein
MPLSMVVDHYRDIFGEDTEYLILNLSNMFNTPNNQENDDRQTDDQQTNKNRQGDSNNQRSKGTNTDGTRSNNMPDSNEDTER